jgi:hypothetical protein
VGGDKNPAIRHYLTVGALTDYFKSAQTSPIILSLSFGLLSAISNVSAVNAGLPTITFRFELLPFWQQLPVRDSY